MRAATRFTPNDSRATRAAITLELSPLLTAANASARSMPASLSTFWSKPMPVIFLPLNVEPQLAERIPVLVDDRDRVALVLQDVREGRSDPPATHDHNVHDRPLDECLSQMPGQRMTDVPANGIPCPD